MIRSKLLSKDKQELFSRELITFIEDEMEEKIGIITAQDFLDFFLEKVGNEIYNKGLEDSKIFFQKKLEDFEFELEELKFN